MKKKQFLGLLLSFMLIFTMMPVSAFAEDAGGESQETSPITVSVRETNCAVESTGFVQYAYGEYIINITNGIYKVIVPEDAESLTITCSDMTSYGNIGFDPLKKTAEKTITIPRSELLNKNLYGEIPNAAASNTDLGETLAQKCGCSEYKVAYVNLNCDEESPSAQYGLLIQFGGESQEQEKVKVSVKSIALKDAAKPLRIGEANTVIATLKNNGTESVSGFKVKLQAGGSKVTELTYAESIDPGAEAEVELAITPQAKGNPNDGKTELKVLVNNQEDTSKSETFIYGKYSIVVECVGANEGEGEMSIASIDSLDGYYDEQGSYHKGRYRPDPDQYKIPDNSSAKYILKAAYGARWYITFDTPDGQCFAYVEYEDGEKVGLNDNKAQLVFDKERFGQAYYEEIQVGDINLYTGIQASGRFSKVAFDKLTEGETYAIHLNWQAQRGVFKRFNTSVYEDERMLTSHDDTGGNYAGIILGKYQPRADAQHLVVVVSQGSEVVARKVIDIKVADAEKKKLQFMETPLRQKEGPGFVGANVGRVHIFSDQNDTKYVTSGSIPLYFAGNGIWEPLEAKGKKILLNLKGGYGEEGKIDLTTLKGVDNYGALHRFDGKEWVKEQDSNYKSLGRPALTQAFFTGDKIVGYAHSGTRGGYLCVGETKDNGIAWQEENIGTDSNCYSLLQGDDGKIYATKYNGSLYQYTGSRWTELRGSTRYPAKVIAAESEHDLWISAQMGSTAAKLLHYDGNDWKEYSTPAMLKELPTGILVTGSEMYCIYLGSLWKSKDEGENWVRQNIDSSGDAANTLTGIQQTRDKGIFYLGTEGAFYYEGTALGETAVSTNQYNARTVRVSISGSYGAKKVLWSGKVTVDNQLDIHPYLTYYKGTGVDTIPKQAARVYGAYNKEEGTGFAYPTVLHALIKMLLDNGVDLETKEPFTYRDGKTYNIPKNLDVQAGLGGKVYLAMAGGLREFDGGNMSGWMYRVNGNLPNLGMSDYAISDGDKINIFYVTSWQMGGENPGSETRLTTREYGQQAEIEIDSGTTLTFHSEVGSSYQDADMAFLYVDGRRYYNYTESGAKETAMTDDDGLLQMTFDKDGVYEIYCYKKGVYAQSNIITVRVGKGNVKPEIRLKAAASRSTPNQGVLLTVTDLQGNAMPGIRLYNAANDEELNGIVTDENGHAKVSFAEKGNYQIYAKGEETKASQAISLTIADEIGDIKTAMSDALDLANTRADRLTGKTPWNGIALDRQARGSWQSGTLNELVQEIGSSIEANSGTQYELVTDYAKWVLAIQAAGGDPSSLVYNKTKINLLEKIYNFHVRLNDGTVKNLYAQGLNAPIWSLIALDSVPETVPQDARYSKADLVRYIVKAQNADGSFALIRGSKGDVDITAMALQALAKHRNEDSVEVAVQKAVQWLAAQQRENGGFASYYSNDNCESTAQTIIALTALGTDPAAAPFRMETGTTMLDALLYYHLGDGSFAHEANTYGVLTANDLASEQAHLALTAYDRFAQNKETLYDMSGTERVDRYAPVITTDLRTYTTNEERLNFAVLAEDAKDGNNIELTVGYKYDENSAYTQKDPDENGRYNVRLKKFDFLAKTKVFFRITATDKAGNTAVEEYVVTYSKDPVVKSISLPKSVQTAEVGKTLKLTAEVTPDNAKNKTLTWTSSDTKVATVDENGNVTALRSGTVTITAHTRDGSNLSAECKVLCELPQSQQPDDKTIKVTFTLLGDAVHGDKKPFHTLRENNLKTWIAPVTVTVEKGSSVGDVFAQILTKHGYTFEGLSKNYISHITTPNGERIGEFTNGNLSGWMYTVNGHHPEVGLNSYILTGGDRIIWHYTDDYTVEEGSEKWNTQKDEVKDVTTDTKTGTTTAPTEVKVSGNTATAKVKAEHSAEIIKQAKENKSFEIILEVSAGNTKGAESVQMQLDTAFVKDIVEKTNADLTVNTENGKVTLDQEALKAIIGEAKGNTVTIEITKVTKPTEVQKKAAGTNGDIFSLLVKSGDKIISDFNKGKATVRVEIPAKLADKKVAAIYLADDAKIEQLAGKVLTIGGKKYYEFTTPHFSTFALVDAEELGLEVEEPQVDAKALTAKLTPIARSAKTAKKNVKVTVSLDKQDKAIIKELKDAGYTVKYRFYRSTKKTAGYKAAVTKKTTSYTNTSGKKGTKYFYKVQVRVYDENGKLTAKTALKQCKYASRIWAKAN